MFFFIQLTGDLYKSHNGVIFFLFTLQQPLFRKTTA